MNTMTSRGTPVGARETAAAAHQPPLFAALYNAAAALRWKLDDQLGRFHGIGFDDLMLLHALSAPGDHRQPAALSLARLAERLRQSPATTLRRVAALEKIGLVARTRDAAGQRCIALRPAGASVLRLGVECAADCGTQALTGWPADMRSGLPELLQGLAQSPAWHVE